MITSSVRMVEDLRFEAVRFRKPVPHWRLRLPNGVILQPGAAGLKGESRPRLWDSLEDLARRIGRERFLKEFG